ncbi:MAG: AAA family ATPase [Proteobacteria bacterium]|nr:AAA family ATPase [Pseudomonadota bacterium]
MKRFAEDYLERWKNRKGRKPLVLRGARQTGKTYLVEKFAGKYFKNYLKVDFEFDLAVKSIFSGRDPEKITEELSLYYGVDIIENHTLLFFDEIQACPEAIATLRYFYEKKPGLHVIAAGSLLDFALRDFEYSMPVGRIEFIYIYPMSFNEFLLSIHPKLYEFIKKWTFEVHISELIHRKLSECLRYFFFTGGMPEAVAAWIENNNLVDVQRIQNSILTTMQNDFAKYGSRKQQEHLQKVMHHIPRNIGTKIKYVNIDRDIRSGVLKEACHLLAMSRVISLVYKSNGNGSPLDAEINPNIFKSIFLDIGLVNRLCGLKLTDMKQLITIYEGGLAEQFIGQELLNYGFDFESPGLYYWTREEKNSNAEIDYLISHQSTLVPVEVKAGKTGSLKSLPIFLYEKKLKHGLRFNLGLPSKSNVQVNIRLKNSEDCLEYTLISLPLYLSGQIDRILDVELVK